MAGFWSRKSTANCGRCRGSDGCSHDAARHAFRRRSKDGEGGSRDYDSDYTSRTVAENLRSSQAALAQCRRRGLVAMMLRSGVELPFGGPALGAAAIGPQGWRPLRSDAAVGSMSIVRYPAVRQGDSVGSRAHVGVISRLSASSAKRLAVVPTQRMHAQRVSDVLAERPSSR